MADGMCHCGRPLHYTDPSIRAKVEAYITELGPNLVVSGAGGKWAVPRHYIALHGLKEVELATLGFERLE